MREGPFSKPHALPFVQRILRGLGLSAILWFTIVVVFEFSVTVLSVFA